jgi:hypothetical protein
MKVSKPTTILAVIAALQAFCLHFSHQQEFA